MKKPAAGPQSKKRAESLTPPGKITAMETTPPTSKNLHGSLPHFMRPTSSSDAKKDHHGEVSSHHTTSPCSNNSGRNGWNSGGRSSTSAKKPKARVACPKLQVNRATCSSTMKGWTFPPYLDLNPGGTDAEGTSVMNVCPYTYCSLNGHHHEPLTPLASFLASRRRMIKSQKTIKLEGASPLRKHSGTGEEGASKGQQAISRRPSAAKIIPVMEETISDFFVEIYASRDKKLEKSMEDQEMIKHSLEKSADIVCAAAEKTQTGLELGVPNGIDRCSTDLSVDYVDDAVKIFGDEVHDQLKFEDSIQDDSADCRMNSEPGKLQSMDDLVHEDRTNLFKRKAFIEELCDDSEMNSEANKASVDGNVEADLFGDSGSDCWQHIDGAVQEQTHRREFTAEHDGAVQEQTHRREFTAEHDDALEMEGDDEVDSLSSDSDMSLEDSEEPDTGSESASPFRVNINEPEMLGEICVAVSDDAATEKMVQFTVDAVVKAEMHVVENSGKPVVHLNPDAATDEKTADVEITLMLNAARKSEGDGEEDNRMPDNDEVTKGSEVEAHSALDSICAAFGNMCLKDDGTNADDDVGEGFRNKIIISRRRRIPEELHMMRGFNPRAPNFLDLEPDPDAETIDLRHQMMDDRKNSEEWMIDYALRRAVNQLAPARKKKVELLVEAFETVSPVQGRPIQACS